MLKAGRNRVDCQVVGNRGPADPKLTTNKCRDRQGDRRPLTSPLGRKSRLERLPSPYFKISLSPASRNLRDCASGRRAPRPKRAKHKGLR